MSDIKEDIAALEKALESAEWTGRWYDGGCGTVMCDYKGDPRFDGEHGEVAHPEPLGIAPYIAACSPDRIRRLLDALEKAETRGGQLAEVGLALNATTEAKLSRAVELLKKAGGEATNQTAREVDAFLKEAGHE